MSSLKDKIKSEMTSDFGGSLERNFEIAKKLIRLTDQGKVEVLNKDRLTGEQMTILYLIGKCYSKEAGYSDSEYVTNKELMEELGKKEGSILPWLMNLRNSYQIKQNSNTKPSTHYVLPNVIESVLTNIDKKLNQKNTQ